ncbi:MAG: hypothetical protein C0596_11000 [Marinilabiliales bacterium]|nr:MAG: hypothetical protein C0596_11000 [Marinilabiliales bacterium]
MYYTRRDKYTEIYEYDNIGDNLHESEITAYPNPFKEQIQINLLEKYSDIQIYDNSGQVILKKHIEDNVFIWDGNDENGYNVKHGNYVVSIISGDSKFLGKIIKIE